MRTRRILRTILLYVSLVLFFSVAPLMQIPGWGYWVPFLYYIGAIPLSIFIVYKMDADEVLLSKFLLLASPTAMVLYFITYWLATSLDIPALSPYKSGLPIFGAACLITGYAILRRNRSE